MGQKQFFSLDNYKEVEFEWNKSGEVKSDKPWILFTEIPAIFKVLFIV